MLAIASQTTRPNIYIYISYIYMFIYNQFIINYLFIYNQFFERIFLKKYFHW